ncbi:Multidrug resistance protein MdtH [Pseudomonas fluorescens]|uniref:Multidrug resistance protein MdtH n=1 Tax=Pseudomonas fluorescens TaxID=294 RepID=A0A5E7KCZ2_PSEFL|nr:MFS transporter [Pseudomonas fluorescens]VVO97686.1 Multidrug resistance protein MdtH [Pseudomonas fluorescens]
MTSPLGKSVKIRLFLHFVEKFIEGAVAPFFIIYLSQRLGEFTVGAALVGVMVLAGAASLVGAHFADVRGRRRVLLPMELIKAGALLMLVGLLLLDRGQTPVLGYALLFLYAWVLVCNGISVPVSEALVLDAVPPGDLRRVYAYLYWITNMARGVGTVAGVLLYELDFAAVVAMTALLATAGAWVVAFHLEETARLDTRRPVRFVEMLSEYRAVLQDRLMLTYVIATTLNFGIAVQLAYYVAVRLSREFGTQTLWSLDDWQPVITGVVMFGILRLETNVIAVCLTHLAQKLTKDIPPLLLYVIGPVIATAGFVVLMVSNDAWTLIAAMALYTLGELLYAPAKMALIARIAPPQARSRYAAVRAFDFRLALILGAASVALAPFVPSWVMAVLVAAMGLGVIVLLITVERRLRVRESRMSREVFTATALKPQ